MKTIFDIGSNNGDDIAYYLHKAHRVIAFEANPLLCQAIEERFSREVRAGRVIVERGVLCAEEDAVQHLTDFYIHRKSSLLSQFPQPDPQFRQQYDKVELPAIPLSSALERYGIPHFAKIDIEHYDHVIVAEFFRLQAFPRYISAECHSRKVMTLLLNSPHYQGFKQVNGRRVQYEYKYARIRSQTGRMLEYSFPAHSAGPFGDDIAGPWYERDSFSKMMFAKGAGWKDLHASRVDRGVIFLPYRPRWHDVKSNLDSCVRSSTRLVGKMRKLYQVASRRLFDAH